MCKKEIDRETDLCLSLSPPLPPIHIFYHCLESNGRLLSEKQLELSLSNDSLPGELVIGREAGRVSREGWETLRCMLLQRVNALAVLLVVSQMHLFSLLRFVKQQRDGETEEGKSMNIITSLNKSPEKDNK